MCNASQTKKQQQQTGHPNSQTQADYMNVKMLVVVCHNVLLFPYISCSIRKHCSEHQSLNFSPKSSEVIKKRKILAKICSARKGTKRKTCEVLAKGTLYMLTGAGLA